MLDYFSQKFFQPFIFDGYFIYFILFTNILIFETLSGCDPISSWFNAIVASYWKHLSSSFFGFIVAFLCPFWRINIWTTSLKIYFVAFVMQQLNWIKNEIASSNWCFETNMVSQKKWLKKFINHFICIIIRCNLYIIALWVHYMLFINIFRKSKVNRYC